MLYLTKLKICSDGLESKELQRASNARKNVQSILIEVDKNYESQKLEIEAILKTLVLNQVLKLLTIRKQLIKSGLNHHFLKIIPKYFKFTFGKLK